MLSGPTHITRILDNGCMHMIYVIRHLYGIVVSMFDFHRSDRGSDPGRGGKIS